VPCWVFSVFEGSDSSRAYWAFEVSPSTFGHALAGVPESFYILKTLTRQPFSQSQRVSGRGHLPTSISVDRIVESTEINVGPVVLRQIRELIAELLEL
jgi:hypothetical protein